MIDLFATNENWLDQANCRGADPNLFFSDNNQIYVDARKICAECEVSSECLNYAERTHQQFGLWGGFTIRERRLLRNGPGVA